MIKLSLAVAITLAFSAIPQRANADDSFFDGPCLNVPISPGHGFNRCGQAIKPNLPASTRLDQPLPANSPYMLCGQKGVSKKKVAELRALVRQRKQVLEQIRDDKKSGKLTPEEAKQLRNKLKRSVETALNECDPSVIEKSLARIDAELRDLGD